MLTDSSIPGQHRLRGLQGLQMPQDLQKMHRLLGSLSEVGGPCMSMAKRAGPRSYNCMLQLLQHGTRMKLLSDTPPFLRRFLPSRSGGDSSCVPRATLAWPRNDPGRSWLTEMWWMKGLLRCRASYQDGMDQSLRLLLNSKTKAGHQPDWIRSKYHQISSSNPLLTLTGWPQHSTTTVSFEQLGIPLGHGSHHDSSLPGSNAQRRGCWGCRGRCSCYSQPGGERLEPSREPWWHWESWRKILGKISMYMYIYFIHIAM